MTVYCALTPGKARLCLHVCVCYEFHHDFISFLFYSRDNSPQGVVIKCVQPEYG